MRHRLNHFLCKTGHIFVFMSVLSMALTQNVFAATCPSGYHSSGETVSNPAQQCFITLTAGQYISNGPLPASFDSSNSATGIRYHGYDNSNDNTLAENTFATEFASGTVYGDSACRQQNNPYGEWNSVTDWDFDRGNEGGGYICWCRLNGANDPSGSYSYKSKWVARGAVDSGNCWADCARDCAVITGNYYGWADTRPKSSLFGNVNITTQDCPAGYYCPGGETNYGSSGAYACPANSSSTAGQTSCTCDIRYATANGQGATQSNPCVRLTGAASCISGSEYWNEELQTCIAKTGTNTLLFNSGEYMAPIYSASSNGYYCHKSSTEQHCDNNHLLTGMPNNSWAVHFNNDSTYFVGRAACSDIGGNYNDVSTVNFNSDIAYGGYCWCNLSSPFGSSKWVLSGHWDQTSDCATQCAGNCGYNFSDISSFKQTVLANIDKVTTTCNSGYYCPGGEYSSLDTTQTHKKCPNAYPESNQGAYKINQCFSTITFNSNGGSSVSAQTFSYNSGTSQYSLASIPTPTRTDYTFDGWYTNSSFTGNKVTTQTQFSEPTTLYAKWISDSAYTVTLNVNAADATAGTTSVSASYGDAMPSVDSNSAALVAPVRNGYTFTGYYSATSGGTKYYNADMTSAHNWDISSNTVLYAQWTPNIITIVWQGTTQAEIDANNAGSVLYGGDINTPRSATHVPGKSFDGWRFSRPSA